MNAHYRYVVLGGGIAGGFAARSFVENGLQPGELLVISADDTLPYDRPSLSKDYLRGDKTEEKILIRPPDFYPSNGIHVALETRVTRVDFPNKRLDYAGLASEGSVTYDRLLIATGSKVNALTIPGADLGGVYYLRWRQDSRAIRDATEGAQRAVVIGGGYIAMEVSAVLAQRGVEPTLVIRESRLMEINFFTPEISAFFQRYYEARGVKFLTGVDPVSLSGKGWVSGVVLNTGQELPADFVVAGIGVRPALDLFEGTELAFERQGITVNEYLETNVADVYAAGDVIHFPDAIFDKQRHIEHWDNAAQSGKHAARMMLGSQREPYAYLPYFFSDIFDLSYEFWGDQQGYDRVVYRGDVDGGKFSAWWLKGDRLIAAFVMGRPDEERDAAQDWIRGRRQVSAEQLQDAGKPIAAALRA